MSEVTVTIIKSNPRAERWQRVFKRVTGIPVTSPFTVRVTVPEKGEVDAYLLDLTRLKPGERQRLVEDIASRFNIPIEEVNDDLDWLGCPVLAEDVSVRIPQGLAFSMMDDRESNDGNQREDV